MFLQISVTAVLPFHILQQKIVQPVADEVDAFLVDPRHRLDPWRSIGRKVFGLYDVKVAPVDIALFGHVARHQDAFSAQELNQVVTAIALGFQHLGRLGQQSGKKPRCTKRYSLSQT